MAIPKRHSAEFDVPELYRIAATSGGILVNTAFGERFGLTAIEASACGLPFVFTQNGGAQDIVENCKSGFVVDVNDQQALTDSMLRLLTEREAWEECSRNGVNLVRRQYTWESHCNRYFNCIKDVVAAPTKTPSVIGRTAPARRLALLDYLLITDIDGTLLGDDDALERLKVILHENRDHLGFGVASGRAPELARQALSDHGIDEIDVIIASVGSEVYYGTDQVVDKGWASRLRSRWRPDRILEALEAVPHLYLQEDEYAQREFKISYNLEENMDADEALASIHEALARAKAAHSRVFSHGRYIDILPHRASKGRAIRYLTGKWNTPLERVVTAGDSGNDRDMLTGQTAGIAVGNHDEELSSLKQSTTHRVYFAEAHCAGGIIEGLSHYGVIDTADVAVAATANA
jgi:sucrose-phosphate synthase